MVLTAVAAATAWAAPPEGRCVMFSDPVRLMLPPVIADFVERYAFERIYADESPAEARRRMAFDEVSLSLPMSEPTAEMLRQCDGIAIMNDRGASYSLTWFDGEKEAAAMQFPASYNLLMFTDQVRSHANLVKRLRESARYAEGLERRYIGVGGDSIASPFRKRGSEFYLGHLASHTYADSISGRPVWTPLFAAESLANLFLCERPVAPVTANLDVKAYDMTETHVELPVSELLKFMADEDCTLYFGVSSIDSDSGMIEAVVVAHNPELAYIHKMTVMADPEILWGSKESSRPALDVKLTPYIKLHNLTNLWGDKK